jgi:hypothetical protein
VSRHYTASSERVMPCYASVTERNILNSARPYDSRNYKLGLINWERIDGVLQLERQRDGQISGRRGTLKCDDDTVNY